MAEVSLRIDGRRVRVAAGASIWEAAQRAGIDIPVLCHHPHLRPAGVCRICAVEVEGARTSAAACVAPVAEGMVVRTETPPILAARRMLVELMLADHPVPCARQRRSGDCALEQLAARYGVQQPRFSGRTDDGGRDDSSPVIAVDHAACILCDRCIRACDEVQANDVIGRSGKGYGTRIAFDARSPMGASTCVSCGECAAVCPTGALTHRPLPSPEADDLKAGSRTAAIGGATKGSAERALVDSVCPYCGVGCAIRYHVRDGAIVQVDGRAESPVNRGRLCVKGRYGLDYVHHPHRLTEPLIRRPDAYPKGPLSPEVRASAVTGGRRRGVASYPEVMRAFRAASWDEALDTVAARFAAIRRDHGPAALAGLGSAKCSNEDNYLLQKLVRAVFGTNNVDHCTRLCHASSVAALMETIGSGAVSNPFADVAHADVALVIGSNTVENHPVAATFIKGAARRGTTLVVIDPRRPGLADHAHQYVRFRPGTDVALLNAVMHVIIRDDLVDWAFVRERTEGLEDLRRRVAAYSPGVAEAITGVPRETIERVAYLYGTARAAMIFWGMGVSQHTTGTDNARCLVALALMTGNVGRPGTGLHPLRGQNNVQGASDVGVLPMVYADYRPVSDPAARRRFERAWGVRLDPEPGLTVVEILGAALEGRVKGLLAMGENPFLSDPNTNKVRSALAALDFLAVQDIFLTETAEFADVILPATSFAEKDGTYTNTDRRVQIGRSAVEPPGQARADWRILAAIATRMGYPMQYASAAEVFAEIASLSPSLAGMSYEKLGGTGVVWPCPSPAHAGTPVLFAERFPRGKGRFVPAAFAPAKELPDREYPWVLNTGRILEHWHTGSMTRRSRALDALAPEPFAEMHPADVRALGLRAGDWVRVSSRRGHIVLRVRCDPRTAPGSVFIPFHFREAAANVLTIDALDPFGKIPEYKFCAVNVEPA